MVSLDEHYYANNAYFNFDYYWLLHGSGLPNDVLKKIYLDSALNTIKQVKSNASRQSARPGKVSGSGDSRWRVCHA